MAIDELTNEFEDISPYSDEEAAQALARVANHPMVLVISKYLFPREKRTFLRDVMKQIQTVDEFQHAVMAHAVRWVIESTMHNFSYDGINNIKGKDCKFLFMSNHRDIILDPALTQYVLNQNGFPLTEIAVGDNLLSSKTVEYLLRSNRMIKVIRGISARELYLSSQRLSKYIRNNITTNRSSVWIAQRQGRTKNGYDITEQGLLKMFDMSGTKGFKENFEELNIVPLSISYEYEPCDIRKAREVLISRDHKYTKKKNEDLHSIIVGIRQLKGDVHLNVGKPLTAEEIEKASHCDKNDRYQLIRHAVDRRVIEGYKLWKTNYICYDLVNHTDKYSDKYTQMDVDKFVHYAERKMAKVEKSLDRDQLRDIFYRIYANPVQAKEDLAAEDEA